MSEYISPYLWCENEIEHVKVKNNVTGKVTRKVMYSSIGPNKHHLLCMEKGCSCGNLEKKMEELYA